MSFQVNATPVLVTQSLSIFSVFWALKQTPIAFVKNNLNLKSDLTTYGAFRAKVVSLTKFKHNCLPWIVKP